MSSEITITMDTASSGNGLIRRRISSDMRLEMGIYPVLYGYRIRAGWNGYGWCEIDWCFAQQTEQLNHYYERLKLYMEQNPKNPFKELPGYSEIKPITRNPEFMKRLNDVLPELEKV